MAKKGATKAVAYAFAIVKGRRVYARDVQRALTIWLRQFDHSAGLWQDRRTMPRALSALCPGLGSGLRLAARSLTVTENGH